jgi:hypothetical protein
MKNGDEKILLLPIITTALLCCQLATTAIIGVCEQHADGAKPRRRQIEQRRRRAVAAGLGPQH